MTKKVLVVDDEPKLREILARVLTEHGFEVLTAVNGRDALDKIPEFFPHLVIADIAMPEMDGFELCKRIREDTRFGALRFIFLTAKDAREDEIEGLMLGADDYITKPFDVDKLLARVDTRLRWLDTAQEIGETSCKIEGGLGARNLLDILQILEMGLKTGELLVSYNDNEAKLVISQGTIINAECGDKKGKYAVYTALTWNEGRFCFTPQDNVSLADSSEFLEITPLLLEWARISDEFVRDGRQSSDDVLEEFLRYVREREVEEEQ